MADQVGSNELLCNACMLRDRQDVLTEEYCDPHPPDLRASSQTRLWTETQQQHLLFNTTNNTINKRMQQVYLHSQHWST